MAGVPSLDDQQRAWNEWNANKGRQEGVGRVSLEQAEVVDRWMRSLPAEPKAKILEVGCGMGWMCERLTDFGQVTGTDLADQVVSEAARRLPEVRFVAGDFLGLDLGAAHYDVVVTLETLSHFEDQSAFVMKIADVLRPGGLLILATQNRPTMERNIKHLPNGGWYRRWVDKHELRALVEQRFTVRDLRSITPQYFAGPLHALNSVRLERTMQRLRLGKLNRGIRSFEERLGLGWTLMCLAQLKEPPPT